MITWAGVWAVLRPVVRMAIILLAGHILIRILVKFFNRGLGKTKMDPSLVKYCSRTITISLHVFVVLAALDSIGVSTGGIIAAITAVVVGIGVALKDSLGNVAGGIWLLFSPRFSTGDYISAGGDEGTVMSIELLHTTLQTPDAKQISIPNGVLINSHITNYSIENKRRVDMLFPIPYEADVSFAKQLALDTISKHPLVIDEPAKPFVRVKSYEDNYVNLTMRAWCKGSDYWTVYFDLIEEIREAYKTNGIDIPYNRLDVHIKNKE